MCQAGHTQCGNCRNSLSHVFRKNFVKAMVLLKKLPPMLKSRFDEKNSVRENFPLFPHFGICTAIVLRKFREIEIDQKKGPN